MVKKGKLLDKIFSDTSASVQKFSILVALIIFALLSVSAVFGLIVSIQQPGDAMNWGNTLMTLNASTDHNANCTYNITDGTNDVVATLGTNDTTDQHVENNIDISSLDEGAFTIGVNCWNSSDGVLVQNYSFTGTKDTSGVEVLAWNEPENGWTVQNGSVMIINITVNVSDTSGLDNGKLDVFDVSDCGGSVSDAEYTDNGDAGIDVNATWTVPSAINIGCDIVANLSTGMPQNVYNQSTITVSVHPDCGDSIGADFTMQTDIDGCAGNGYTITADDVVLDCAGHSITGPGTGGSTNGVYITPGLQGVTVKNCIIDNFANGVTVEKTEAANINDRDHVIQNNTFHTVTRGVYLNGRATYYIMNITIQNNTVLNTTAGGTGIYNDNSGLIEGTIIRYNEIYDAGYGIATLKNDDHQITHNIINNTAGYGIQIEFSGYGEAFTGNITDNTIDTATNGAVGTGIIIFNGGASYAGKEINVFNNTITNCAVAGMDVTPASTLRIYHNNIYDNTLQITSSGAIELSNGAQGNFWGRSSCPYFIASTDSNGATVVDSYPYNQSDGWSVFGNPPACISCGDTISSDLTLTADLVCSGDSVGLDVDTDEVTIDCNGFAILGDDTADSFGIELNGASDLTVYNCTIANWTTGIYVDDTNNSITYSTLTNNSVGIELETDGSYTIIQYNQITNSDTGILLLDQDIDADINISHNNITGNIVGVNASNVNINSGGMVQLWYNDIYSNTLHDVAADSSESDGFAPNMCTGMDTCYGNYWGISDHCPYFRDANTNLAFDTNGFRDMDAYSSSRIGQSLTDAPGCTICGDSIDWVETLEDNVYNSSGGTTCGGNFAVELTQSDSSLDCAGHDIMGSGSGVGVSLPNTSANNITVKNCRIMEFTGNPNAAINITGGENHTFYNNSLYGNVFGIRKATAQPNAGYNITGNTIMYSANAGTGIYLYLVTDFIIQDNKLDDCDNYGINLVSSVGSVLSNGVNDSTYGIYLNAHQAGAYQVMGNSINNSDVGLRLWNVQIPVNVTGNDFYDNLVGISLEGTTTLSTVDVWHNNILDSVTYGVMSVGAIELSNGSEGNYWGHASCPVFSAGVDSNATDITDSFPYNATNAWVSTDPAPSCSVPNVTLENPGAGASPRIYGMFNFSVNVTDIVNVQTVTVYNGTGAQVMYPSSGSPSTEDIWWAIVDTTAFLDGARTLLVNATNNGQSNDTEYFTVIVDNTGPIVDLNFPETTNFNTSTNPEDFDYNATDMLLGAGQQASQYMNCTVYLYNASGNVIAANNGTVPNETIVENTLSFFSGAGVYNWNVTCYDYAISNMALTSMGNAGSSATYQVTYDDTPPTPGSAALGEADMYVSGVAPNQNITVIVTATDVGTGVKNVTANFTDVTDDPADVYPMVFNGTHWNYTFVTDTADTGDAEFDQYYVNFTITDYAGLSNSALATPVVLYNMTVPSSDETCIRYEIGTTDFSLETDFADVDFVVVVGWNYSQNCGYLGPGANNQFNTVARINFTGLDFSTPATAAKLQQLDDAVEVSITPDGNFGNSRVYVNSTFFEELNTTATVALYNLPFDNLPNVSAEAEAAGYDAGSITYTTYSHPTFGEVGNLTFNVAGFSGYNVSDIVLPTIIVNAPTPNMTTVGGTTPLINVTVNGTGTQVSNVTIWVDSDDYYMDDMTCYNATGSEEMNCYFSPTIATDGNHQLNIIARDYGGATGNGNSTVWNFTTDSSRPSVTGNQSNATGTVKSTTVLLLNVTATDGTNVSNVTVGVAGEVLMGNHTADDYNVTTTPATLGCGQGWCTVYFNASDYWGNYNDSTSATFFVDDAGPNVTGVSVTNATNVSSSVQVNIQATVTDVSNIASVFTNNSQQLYLLSGNIYHANLTATDLGCSPNTICTIMINATDNLGNYNDTETTSYYVDDANPAVTSPSASPAEVKSASALYIGAIVSDVSNVTSVVSNNSVALTKGASSWNATTSAGALGCAANAVCTIGFTATDMAGNANDSVTTTVTVDDIAPVVTFVYNSTDVVKGGTPLTLNVTVVEANTIASVTANGRTMNSPSLDGNYTYGVNANDLGCPSSNGACLVTFVANDTAGNSHTDTMTLNIDEDGPLVTDQSVTNTTNGKQKRNTVVNIAATVTDTPAGVSTVTVNGTPMYLMGGTWQANVSGATLGCVANSLCTLTFTATDALSNVNNTVTTSYTVDDLAPSNNTIFSGSGTTSSTVSATMNEAAKCTVNYGTNESVLNQSANSSSFLVALTVTFSTSASTVYYYNITDCWDELGNSQNLNLGPFNFTTGAAGGTGGGGGGGGGGTYSTSSTIELGDITGAQIQMELGKGDTMNFGHDGEQHEIRVTSLSSSYADFEVMSELQSFRLYIGQSNDVDVNNDAKPDITVKLLDIIGGKALVKVTSMLGARDKIVLLPPAKRTVAETPAVVADAAVDEAAAPAAPEQTVTPAVTPAPAPEAESDGMSTTGLIFAILLVVVVIVVIAVIVAEVRKKSNHGLK